MSGDSGAVSIVTVSHATVVNPTVTSMMYANWRGWSLSHPSAICRYSDTPAAAAIADTSDQAFRELVRVLEEAVRAGVISVGLEYKGRELIAFHQTGPLGLGTSRISQELQQDVIAELVKRAGLSRKSRGKMQVNLLGKDYEVVVEEYDSFGESAYNLTLKERKKKAGG